MRLLRRLRQELVDDDEHVEIGQRLLDASARGRVHERIVARNYQRFDRPLARAVDDAADIQPSVSLERLAAGPDIRRNAHIARAVCARLGRQRVERARSLSSAQQQGDVGGGLRCFGGERGVTRVRREDDGDSLFIIFNSVAQDAGGAL